VPDPLPSPEELGVWRRRLAGQANNRAWDLCEASRRTAVEDDELLHAAHAAMHLWSLVGTLRQRAHAALLLAHAHALLGLGSSAARYLSEAQAGFDPRGTEPLAPWESALLAAIEANVAAATGDSTTHARQLALAEQQVAALPDPAERAQVEATLRVIPTSPPA
jgi:hypothetical protein